MTDKKHKIALIIAGATGVGKTSVACDVAERLSGEIISADARQVYRRMIIGTASPVNEDVRHHIV
ncbi:MAG: isopentenyl transferase family protein, partial [bacterium]